MKSYRFGYLREKVTYQFSGGKIAPVAAFDQIKEWIRPFTHKDGFLYPPTGESRNQHGERLPNTERPAHLHRLPASHELELDFRPPSPDPHRALASLIIHLTAYLHGTCVQFDDWWFDARVPLVSHHHIVFATKTAEHFLSHACTVWQGWPEPARKRFTNILFMLNRAPSYEWDWEHFTIEYMILDACYRVAEELGIVKKSGGHPERITKLCEAFGLQKNEALRREIVALRNDLFHEALWDRAQPGTAAGISAFYAPLHLRRFNQRLILALLGYQNEYVGTSWWSLGTCLFATP